MGTLGVSGVTLHESRVWGERLPRKRESKPDACPSDFCPSLHNGLGFKLAIHVAGEALIFSVFTFKCDRFCLSCLVFLSPLISILFFSHPLSCTLLPSLPLPLPFLSQYVDVNWPREASSCVRVNTSVLWTTSDCMGLAASAARTSSRGRWCPPWARPTTPAASSAPPASKKRDVGKSYSTPYLIHF